MAEHTEMVLFIDLDQGVEGTVEEIEVDSIRNTHSQYLTFHGQTFGEAITNLRAFTVDKLEELETRTDEKISEKFSEVEKRVAERLEKHQPATVQAQPASAGPVEEIPRLGNNSIQVPATDQITGEDNGVAVNQSCSKGARSHARKSAKEFKCKYCKKVFATKGSMQTHIRTACPSAPVEEQLADRRMVCKKCNKSYSAQYMIYQHSKSACRKSKGRGPK